MNSNRNVDSLLVVPAEQVYIPLQSEQHTDPNNARFSWNQPPSDVTDEFITYYNATNTYDTQQSQQYQTNTEPPYTPHKPQTHAISPHTSTFPPRTSSSHQNTHPYRSQEQTVTQPSYAELPTPAPVPSPAPSELPTPQQYKPYRSPIQQQREHQGQRAGSGSSGGWEYQRGYGVDAQRERGDGRREGEQWPFR